MKTKAVVRVGGLPVGWRTLITQWQPGRRFVDLQEAGPYRLWWHEHTFQTDGGRTIMEDRVSYAPPLGILGRLAHRLFMPMARASTVNDDPIFLEMMADEVVKTWARYRTGRPLSLCPRP